jgi:hypothetical protein
MRTEPAALILAAAGLLNAVVVIAGTRLGLTEVEVGLVTSGVLAVATALVRARVTPAEKDPAA